MAGPGAQGVPDVAALLGSAAGKPLATRIDVLAGIERQLREVLEDGAER